MTQKKPSSFNAFTAYVYIIRLTAFPRASVCLSATVLTGNPRGNNSHRAVTGASATPEADTPSWLGQRCSQLPPYPGTTTPDRSTATCQAFIIDSVLVCACACSCVVTQGEGVRHGHGKEIKCSNQLTRIASRERS